MKEITALHQVLQPHIDWHKARLVFCASFIVALVKVRTVNLTQIALALNPAAKPASNYRRIQRFLADFEVDFEVMARLMIALVPLRSDFVVTLDRTNWQFGRTPINIFMIGVAWRGLAFPIMWQLLPKSGISSTGERIALMERFLEVVPPDRIRAIVADREFVGRDWIAFLHEQNLRFVIRIRKNARIGSERRARPAREHFASLRAGHVQVLRKKRWVYGHRLFVVGLRLEPGPQGERPQGERPQGELLLLVTGEQPRRALGLYRQRWQIETLFGALKSRGFNFEETHLTDSGRIEKLVALLAVAYTWAYLVGDWLDRDVRPIQVKSHGRRAKSLFRYGLDHLRSVLLNMAAKIDEFFACLQVLSCTECFQVILAEKRCKRTDVILKEAAAILRRIRDAVARRIRWAWGWCDHQLMQLGAHIPIFDSLYYAFFNRSFDRENRAVLAGRLAHDRSQEGAVKTSSVLRRGIHRLEKGILSKPRRDVFALGYIRETVRFYETGRACAIQ